jgi:ferredoxin
MRDVSRRTGAKIVDFVNSGGREVRGRLAIPRKYLVTNAYFDADIVVNAASCRSHVGIGISGAIKNMFGCVIGLRKQLIHDLFPSNPRSFGRAIADIYRTIPADISFLDLTTVAEAAGISLRVRPVGLVLGGVDAVALDTVAAHAIGYQNLMLWANHFAAESGVGCNRISDISIRGVDWSCLHHRSLAYPSPSPQGALSVFDRLTAQLNHTLLRPRPVIDAAKCTGCGDCVRGCPVACISADAGEFLRINLSECGDCGCCLKTCELEAVQLQFLGFSKFARLATNSSLTPPRAKSLSTLDPARGS